MASSAVKMNGNGQPSAQPQASTSAVAVATASRQFVKNTYRLVQPGETRVGTLSAASNTVRIGVPIRGHIDDILLRVQATSAGNSAPVAFQADAPWTFINQVTFRDGAGSIIHQISGYDLYLSNRWGSYRFGADPIANPMYVTPVTGTGATGGTFAFGLYVPVAFMRDAIGALPNSASSSEYVVEIVTGTLGQIYSTAPTVPPSWTIAPYLRAYASPPSYAANGQPQATSPFAFGTVQYWTKQTVQFQTGQVYAVSTRKGQRIRTTVLVFRNASGARAAGLFTGDLAYELDSQQLVSAPDVVWQQATYEAFNRVPDIGLFVQPYTTEPDGIALREFGDEYIRTDENTLIAYRFTAAAAGSLDIITNDVRPGVNFDML